MQKILCSALTFAVAFASKDQFPSYDAFHANCGMEVTYAGQTCDQVYTKLDAKIRSLYPEPSAGGLYEVLEEGNNDYIWATRTTPTKHYVDDILFEFRPAGSDCVVKSKSRSQTTSYYDYETNYCNMYNPHRYVGGFSNLKTQDCKWVPKVADETCNKY